MTPEQLAAILNAVSSGSMSVEQATDRLSELPFADLGYAKLDLHRELRSGQPEVVYGEGKSDEELIGIIRRFVDSSGRVLVTRVQPEREALLKRSFPDGTYTRRGTVFTLGRCPTDKKGALSVVSAGTSDLAIAEEAAVCAEWLGHEVQRIYDVGVAGLHRLLARVPELREAQAIVVVAGMDGALPTVVAGLVRCPVIAVPTSVGYGAAFEGLAALLTMLNGCSPGVAVVNIDNGFGAAMMASRILSSSGLRGEHPSPEYEK